ncbi:Diacylglycerol acyltransferase domain containing protein [Naviculisporaceae sp. PSN 640]
MDAQDSESSNRAAGSSSSKKKGGKKKAQAQANATKKPTSKSQRSEIPVLRVIDGNAAPSHPPPTSSSNGATYSELNSPAQSKKEQKLVFEDKVENADSPARARTRPKRTNGSSKDSAALDADGNGHTDEVTSAPTKPKLSKPEAAFYAAADAVTNNVAKLTDKANDSEKEPEREGTQPETYAEAVKEGLQLDGDSKTDGEKDGPDDKVSFRETNGTPTVKQTSAEGPRQRNITKEKQDEQDDDYPDLPIPEGLQVRGDRHNQVRLDAYEAGGVRFAPWNIPLRRRLQTLAVMIHCLSIASTASFFFFLCAIPLTWPLLIPYLLHILLSKAATDGKLRFRSERFRRMKAWKHFADYFPAKLHKTHDLPPTRKYIFGYHPHGIISHGGFAAFATEALGFSEKFPGITNSLLTLDSNFRIPIYREYILSLGIRSVSKESILNTLTQGGPNNEGMGRAVTIVIGGARESLEAQPGTMHLVLAERKGFIKLAIRTGADLVPVLAFGENDLYDQVSPKTHPNLRRLQMYALRTLKFTLPFLHGRGIFNYDVGLMPYRRPLNIVVGKPIKVAQAKEGTFVDSAEVDRLHGLYVKELTKMWDRYKDQFAPRRTEELQIMK